MPTERRKTPSHLPRKRVVFAVLGNGAEIAHYPYAVRRQWTIEQDGRAHGTSVTTAAKMAARPETRVVNLGLAGGEVFYQEMERARTRGGVRP